MTTRPCPVSPRPVRGQRPVAVCTVRLAAARRTAPATTAPPSTAPPSTAPPTMVTLQPASPAGGIPGDANDPADLWGLGAALVAIAVALVVTRATFRRRGDRTRHVTERHDPPPGPEQETAR